MVRNAKRIVILVLVAAVVLKGKVSRFDFIMFWIATCVVFLFLCLFEPKLLFAGSEADANKVEKIFKEEKREKVMERDLQQITKRVFLFPNPLSFHIPIFNPIKSV
jgi:hypothetical protein